MLPLLHINVLEFQLKPFFQTNFWKSSTCSSNSHLYRNSFILGGIETNIPKKDKTTIENNKIKIGTIHGDVLTDSSTKIINNGLPDSVQKDSSKNK